MKYEKQMTVRSIGATESHGTRTLIVEFSDALQIARDADAELATLRREITAYDIRMDNDAKTISDLRQQLADAESHLPSTFYADRDLAFRVKKITNQWRKLMVFQEKVEQQIAAKEAALEAAVQRLRAAKFDYDKKWDAEGEATSRLVAAVDTFLAARTAKLNQGPDNLNERAARAMGREARDAEWGPMLWLNGDWLKDQWGDAILVRNFEPESDYNHARLLYDRVVEMDLRDVLAWQCARKGMLNSESGSAEVGFVQALDLTATQLTTACVEVMEKHERKERDE
jgi:hypothetical protein